MLVVWVFSLLLEHQGEALINEQPVLTIHLCSDADQSVRAANVNGGGESREGEEGKKGGEQPAAQQAVD